MFAILFSASIGRFFLPLNLLTLEDYRPRMRAPRRDLRGDPLAFGHLTFNGEQQIRIDRADGVNVFGHAGDTADDANLAIRLIAIRRDKVGKQSDIAGIDHFVDKATDDLLIEFTLIHL